MSCWFSCVVVGFVTVPTHTVGWFACFGVPIPSACVDLVTDNLVNHKVLRVFFVFSFVIFRLFEVVRIINIVSWSLLLLVFLG